MLREFFFWQVYQELPYCYFCEEPIIALKDIPETFGHRRHPSVKIKFTIHHEDGNRDNNHWTNLKISHARCHKKFHMQERQYKEKI
jgi:hypothetical protein